MYENWLWDRAPGYRRLSPGEREAVSGFLHFWALFEGRLMNGSASPDKLCQLSDGWGDLGGTDAVRDALDYYRQRYFPDGEEAERFESLRFRRNDRRDLVEAVMRRDQHDAESRVATVLLIIYRLRNNLFHGEKWQYGLAGQQENFEHANNVLMAILERYAGL